MEEKSKAADKKIKQAEAEQAAKKAAASAKKPAPAPKKVPPKSDEYKEAEAIAKMNADIHTRKSDHAKKMQQFDAIIADAGKEGASLESASAAWKAFESKSQEVENEQKATESDPGRVTAVKAKVKKDIAVKKQAEQVEV